MNKITVKKEIIVEPIGNAEVDRMVQHKIALKEVKFCDICIGSLEDADQNEDEILKQLGINVDDIR